MSQIVRHVKLCRWYIFLRQPIEDQFIDICYLGEDRGIDFGDVVITYLSSLTRRTVNSTCNWTLGSSGSSSRLVEKFILPSGMLHFVTFFNCLSYADNCCQLRYHELNLLFPWVRDAPESNMNRIMEHVKLYRCFDIFLILPTGSG